MRWLPVMSRKTVYHATGDCHIIRVHHLVDGEDTASGALVWHAVNNDPKLVVVTNATVDDWTTSRMTETMLFHT